MDFMRDLVTDFGDFLTIMPINPDDAVGLYLQPLHRPSKLDAGVFEGVIFEDNYDGAPIRYVVPPVDVARWNFSLERDSVWNEMVGRRREPAWLGVFLAL